MTTLVSIRMPRPLVKEMKKLVEKNHYLDFSEQLRSIIRQQAQQYLEPPKKTLQKQNVQLRKQELLRELKNLLEVDE